MYKNLQTTQQTGTLKLYSKTTSKVSNKYYSSVASSGGNYSDMAELQLLACNSSTHTSANQL